jgi:WD40 repeat protein
MRARLVIAVSMLVMFVLPMFSSPSGQTAILPEVTPEATIEPMAEPVPSLPTVFRASSWCAFTPDGAAVVVGGDGVYNLPDGSLRFALSGVGNRTVPFARFSPDGALVMVYHDGVYDLETGERRADLSISTSFVPITNERLVTEDGIYDLTSGELIYDLSGHRDYGKPGLTLRFLPDQRFAAVSLGDFQPVTLIDVETGIVLAELEDLQFATSPDGTMLAVAEDGVYPLGSETPIFTLPETSHEYTPQFSPDSALVSALSDDDVTIYDAATGEVTLTIPYPDAPGVAFGSAYFPEPDWLLLQGYDLRLDQTQPQPLGSEMINWLYELPSAELIFKRAGYLNYVGGARKAWAQHGMEIFDPYTGEMLLASVHSFITQFLPDRVLAMGRGEFNIDTWTMDYVYPSNLPPAFIATDDARRFAVAHGFGVYDAQTGELLMPVNHESVYLTRDGRYVLADDYQSCTVYRLPEAQE